MSVTIPSISHPIVQSNTELDNILLLNTVVDGFYTLFGLEHLQIKKDQEIKEYTKEKWNIVCNCVANKLSTLVSTGGSKDLLPTCNTVLEYIERLKEVQPIMTSLFPTAPICSFDLDTATTSIKNMKLYFICANSYEQ